ncbi:hypothetical protein G7043_32560 [Lentzea sp. NEAU-D13]|uniref:Uncharacterized protein n=1 Tax=Lentzea alba TaxID=2714351 RepID=A0A7C9W153_9PSEU|nr:hypothetical protein [Lentzea alba]NGY63661.1 hypothetical protein [Lentzea alba]
MREIRGLLVEDLKQNVELIKSALGFEFGKAWKWTVQWSVCNDLTSARLKIAEPEVYDFAIVDLHLGEGQLQGVPAVEDLVKRSERTFVVAVTGDQAMFAEHAARIAGLEVPLIIRKQLTNDQGDWAFPALAAKIRKRVITHDPVDSRTLLYDDDKIGMVSVLESLGGPEGDIEHGAAVARSLAMSCLEDVNMQNPRFHLGYLTAGKSGAHVCKVDYSDENRSPQSFVLKIGLDKRALEHELQANRRAAEALPEQTLVRILGEVRTDRSGYSAIIARVADRAQPLSDWLRSGASATSARSFAHILFDEVLGRLSAPHLKDEIPISQWLRSSAIMRLRARAMVDRIAEILEHPAGANRADAAVLRREITDFVEHGTLPVEHPGRLDGSVVLVSGFGDLHSSNVLVQQGRNPNPVLIDASRFGRHHWAADLARMTVDVFLRVRGTGVKALLWEDFAESADVAGRLCPRCDRTELAGDEAVDHFLDEVVTQLPGYVQFEGLDISAERWHWQWHVALAKEWFRQGCHPDLPLPRGVLAFVAGAHHLRTARELVDQLTF